MQEPQPSPSLSLSLGEKSRNVPSTIQPGPEVSLAESAKLIRLRDEAWQGLSGLAGTGENIQGSQLSLESPDLAYSQDSSLRLFPSSEGPSFHPFSVWGVDRTKPPNRATQNMRTHIYPHACVDTDSSHAFLPKPLSSLSRFRAACQAQ